MIIYSNFKSINEADLFNRNVLKATIFWTVIFVQCT